MSAQKPDSYYEPLERLKRLESRLQNKYNQADSKSSNTSIQVRKRKQLTPAED